MAEVESSPARRIERSHQWWILGALIAVGAFLRLVDLGQLAFRWDEDLSSLAAKAIAEYGVPELPSGMIYVRGLPFLYLLAGSGSLLGFEEWALRLPAALFGIAMIPLAFAFGKRLFGTGVGLVLAALVTFSVWDIEFSRYARMYAPFAFFYMLTLLCIWRWRIVDRDPAGSALCVVFALVALSLHDLAYTLAPAFLLPLLLDGRRVLDAPRSLVFPLAAAGTVAAGFFGWQKVQDRYFNRAATEAIERGGPGPAELPADLSLRALENETASGGGLLDLLGAALSQLRLPPDTSAFSGLADTMPVAAFALPTVALLAVGAFGLVRLRRLHPADFVLLPLVALCCGFQLFNLALLAVIALAFAKRDGVRAFRTPEVAFALLLVAAFFAVWFAATVQMNLLGLQELGLAASVKEAIRQLLNYPSFFVFWGFPNEHPLMSIPALIGGLWAFDRAARPQPDRAAVFLLAVFALPMVLNGMFETRYQNFRYNVPFGMLFFAFVALGLLKWHELAAAFTTGATKRASRPGRARFSPALGTALLAVAVLVYDMNPLRSWLVTQRAYSNEGRLYALFDLSGFRDYRSAAEFVAVHAEENDTILTFDCREYYNYLGHMDYCIVSGTYRDGEDMIQTYIDDGRLRDLYVATPMILNAGELERVLDEAPGTKWLLASDSIFENRENFDEGVLALLEQSQQRVVHVARDGATKVYRF